MENMRNMSNEVVQKYIVMKNKQKTQREEDEHSQSLKIK